MEVVSQGGTFSTCDSHVLFATKGSSDLRRPILSPNYLLRHGKGGALGCFAL